MTNSMMRTLFWRNGIEASGTQDVVTVKTQGNSIAFFSTSSECYIVIPDDGSGCDTGVLED